MKRINGFLDLDSYYKEKYGDENKPFSELGYVRKSEYANPHQFWLTIDGKEYYYKETEFAYNEMVCFELAKTLGIKAIEYDLAIYKNFKGVISPSYIRQGYKYQNGHAILQQYYQMHKDTVVEMSPEGIDWEYSEKYFLPSYDMNNIMMIWQALEACYPQVSTMPLVFDVISQFNFAMLTEQYDKGPQNWEVESGPDGTRIVPLFDNESAFNGIRDVYGINTAITTDYSDYEQDILNVIKRYLTISSEEYVDYFIQMYNRLTEDELEKAFKKVEIKTGAPIPLEVQEVITNSFKEHRQKIADVLKELNFEHKIGR